MGFVTESQIKQQAKNLQGETNQRLDAIRELLQTQNELLTRLVDVLGHPETRPV